MNENKCDDTFLSEVLSISTYYCLGETESLYSFLSPFHKTLISENALAIGPNKMPRPTHSLPQTSNQSFLQEALSFSPENDVSVRSDSNR